MYFPHGLCVRAHSRQYSGSCSGVMLLLLLLVRAVAAVVAAAAYSALCVSGSVLFLALFPPCPILQSVDQVTVLYVLFIYPSYTITTTPLQLNSNPQTATLTQGHALKQPLCCQGQHAPALQGNGCYCC